MKRTITILLWLAFAVNAAMAAATLRSHQQEQSQKKEPPRTTRITKAPPLETIRHHLQRLGKPIDEAKSKDDVVVSYYDDAKKGRVAIAITYNRKKDLIGFFIYDFGNVKRAPDPAALQQYLLSANDELSIGAFFVDSDHDIGYKYLLAPSQLTFGSFENVFLTMGEAALERRTEIRRLAGAERTGTEKGASGI